MRVEGTALKTPRESVSPTLHSITRKAPRVSATGSRKRGKRRVCLPVTEFGIQGEEMDGSAQPRKSLTGHPHSALGRTDSKGQILRWEGSFTQRGDSRTNKTRFSEQRLEGGS